MPTDLTRVLLIEDNPGDARLIRELLTYEVSVGSNYEGPRYTIEHAARLTEGLSRLSTESFDVVLLDLSLPDSHGLETLHRLRQDHAGIPLVILTGQDDDDLAVRALREGTQEYLVKGMLEANLLARCIRYAVWRKRIEDALRASEEKLRQAQKMEAIGRLAGGVAHDFNNLLTSVLGFSRIAYEMLEESHPARECLQEVQVAAERAAQLTRQLLTFSRKQIVQPDRVNLHEVIERLQDLLRRTLGEDIDVVLDLDAKPVWIHADPAQIEQLIVNLGVSARDAMPRGGTVTLRTRCIVPDTDFLTAHPDAGMQDYVAFSVLDNGTPLTPEEMQHLFEPFALPGNRSRGAGIGLSAAYSIVRQCQGFIDVHSMPEQGTEFRIFLPLVATPDETGEKAAMVGLRGGHETILVVEDEATLRQLCSRILRGLGYRVLEADHGRTGLHIALSHPENIDLILADVVMPQLSGPAMIQELWRKRKDFKVLYMSGFTSDKLAAAGADSAPLLLKPFTHVALARKVREILDH